MNHLGPQAEVPGKPVIGLLGQETLACAPSGGTVWRLCFLCLLLGFYAPGRCAAQPSRPADKPSISLSPAVVMARAVSNNF